MMLNRSRVALYQVLIGLCTLIKLINDTYYQTINFIKKKKKKANSNQASGEVPLQNTPNVWGPKKKKKKKKKNKLEWL